jgi:hypothetical protein
MSRFKCAAQKYVEKKMEYLIGWMWVVEHVFLCSKFQKVCGTCNSMFQAPDVNLWKAGFTELCSICCGVLDDFFPACWSARLERHVAIMHKLSYNEFQHDSFLLGVAKWFCEHSCMNNLNEIQELFQFSFCESLNYFKYTTQNQVPGFD